MKPTCKGGPKPFEVWRNFLKIETQQIIKDLAGIDKMPANINEEISQVNLVVDRYIQASIYNINNINTKPQ